MPVSADFDFDPIEVLTFDCDGTLIDWECGLLSAYRPMVGSERTSEHLPTDMASFAKLALA